MSINRLEQSVISAIVPSYKNPKCLDICLRSFLDTSDPNVSDIVCVIDGFPDLYSELLAKYQPYEKIHFVISENNNGMPFALNIGVYSAKNPLVLVLNDDNVFPKDWDKTLISLMRDNYIISPNQIEAHSSIFNFVHKDFGDVDNFQYDEFLSTEPNLRVLDASLTTDGEIFPFCITKKAFMSVGGFDLIYPSPFVCDWDFFLKLELLNYQFYRTRSINFYHFGSIATKKSSNINDATNFHTSEIIASNIFAQKWGFEPNIHRPSNSHKPPNMPVTINGVSYDG